MANRCFGGRSYNRIRKHIVFFHPFGHSNTADAAFSGFVFAPGMTAQVPADHHFHFKRLAHTANGNHWIGSGNFPIRNNVRSSIQKLGSYLVEHLPFVWNRTRQHHIKRRNTVAGNHDQQFVVDIIHIAYFADIQVFKSGKCKIGAGDGVLHGIWLLRTGLIQNSELLSTPQNYKGFSLWDF